MNALLEHALLYARAGWPIFPVSQHKIPFKGSHGHLDATTDAQAIRAWWTRRPHANVALATGALVAIDLDGTAWHQSQWGGQLTNLLKANGGLPATLMQRTSGGVHLIFRAGEHLIRSRNEPRSKGSPGVDIKAHGGFIVIAPSRNKNGHVYRWLNHNIPAVLPDWLAEFLMTVGHDSKIVTGDLGLGPRPSYLPERVGAARGYDVQLKPDWSLDEEQQVRAALSFIPTNCGHDEFVRVGLALEWLAWSRSDGSDVGFELFDEWCARADQYYNPHGLEVKWASIQRQNRGECTIGTLYHMARRHGWSGQAVVKEVVPHQKVRTIESTGSRFVGRNPGPNKTMPLPGYEQPAGATPQLTMDASDGGMASMTGAGPAVKQAARGVLLNGARYPMPAILDARPVRFPDLTDDGFPKATMFNAKAAIGGLNIRCQRNKWNEKNELNGTTVGVYAGNISDDALTFIRHRIRATYRFDPGTENTRHAAEGLCLENAYNPLLDWLDTIEWDGTNRIDRWLIDYCGADDTELNRAFSRLVLIAAARRARDPGKKFDQILVLEGAEGIQKSSGIHCLAMAADVGIERQYGIKAKQNSRYFSSQHILGQTSERQQEAIEGVWLYEIADLTGMRHSDVEQVKAFLSRDEDRARAAYARYRTDNPRKCIFFATTNEDDYLLSRTGNRRFWPVCVKWVDLERLAADREQLWAEASTRERQGETIELDPRLWSAARELQDSRLEAEPWFEMIERWVNAEKNRLDDVSTREVLVENPHMNMAPERINRVAEMRAAKALKQLGFVRYKKREGKALAWRYRRPEKS